jgi:hypothetical protein
MLPNILAILASGFGLWAVFKYVILIEMRIDANTFKTIFDLCKEDKKIMLNEEFVSESRYPVIYSAICLFKEAPWFYINHSERLMQAGWHSTDHVTIVCCLRWNYKKMRHYLKAKLKEMQLCTLGVPVELMLPQYTDKIGSLKETAPEPKTIARSKAPAPIQPLRGSNPADVPLSTNGEWHGTFQAWKEARKAGKIR